MSLTQMPTDSRISSREGVLTPIWQSFLQSVNFWLSPVGTFGSTANRPMNSSRTQLYVGQAYFDTTLGFPVYVKTLNPTVWVDGSGTVR